MSYVSKRPEIKRFPKWLEIILLYTADFLVIPGVLITYAWGGFTFVRLTLLWGMTRFYLVETVLVFMRGGQTFQQRFFSYFTRIWNWLDILVSLLFLSTVAMWITSIGQTPDFDNRILNDPTYVNFQFPAAYFNYYRYLLGVLCAFMWYKLMEFAILSKLLGLLVRMLLKMLLSTVSYFLIFLVFILSFGTGFIPIFDGIYDRSNLSFSILANMRWLIGDIDYSALQAENRILGPAVYVLYLLICIWMLLSLLIAIYGDVYNDFMNDPDGEYGVAWAKTLTYLETKQRYVEWSIPKKIPITQELKTGFYVFLTISTMLIVNVIGFTGTGITV